MIKYNEDAYLMLSGIQHYAFCPRQWALIQIEQQWADNYRTTDGTIMHERVHDPRVREKRKDLIITRAVAVSSSKLGISGECDIVEFHRSDQGITLPDTEGKFAVIPVEYKRGKPKENDCDVVQLTAQALCLEEMLCCNIPSGYLYYGETKHRLKVSFDSALRTRTENLISEMHRLFERKHTPRAKRRKACNACSLKDICLPVLGKKQNASDYINTMLNSEDPA